MWESPQIPVDEKPTYQDLASVEYSPKWYLPRNYARTRNAILRIGIGV